MGFAAAGARLVWPVLVIAVYHALGLLITGRSPMLALILDQTELPAAPVAQPEAPRVTQIVAVDDPTVAVRADRTAAAAARTPTGRFRQPGRRGSRGARARA